MSRLTSVLLLLASFLMILPADISAAQTRQARSTFRVHLAGLYFYDDLARIGSGPSASSMTFDKGFGAELAYEYRRRKAFGVEASLGVFSLDASSEQGGYWNHRDSRDTVLYVPFDVGLSFYLRDSGSFRLRSGPFITAQFGSGESLDVGLDDNVSYGFMMGWEWDLGDGPYTVSASARYHRIVVADLGDNDAAHAVVLAIGIGRSSR